MKPNPDTFQFSSDIIEKLLLKGIVSSFQLPGEAKIDSSLPSSVFGTNAKEKNNEAIQRKPFAERIQKVKEFVSATDAYIYYADYEEDYGDYYIGATDTIHLSYPVDFLEDDASQIANYYRILFHELAHWTSHPHRLNRCHNNLTGSLSWAKEELTAELTAAFLLSKFGITENSVANDAVYLDKWAPIINLVNDNKTSISAVVLQANQACDYLFNLQNKFI